VRAYDPIGMTQAKAVLEDVRYVDSAYACAEGADALVIVTEWDMFRALDLGRIKSLLAKPNFIDLRNIYDPNDVEAAGLSYTGIGRLSPAQTAAKE